MTINEQKKAIEQIIDDFIIEVKQNMESENELFKLKKQLLTASSNDEVIEIHQKAHKIRENNIVKLAEQFKEKIKDTGNEDFKNAQKIIDHYRQK
jgi:CRISPR/Cas system-associated exonuclease Cas4 (RecB family)